MLYTFWQDGLAVCSPWAKASFSCSFSEGLGDKPRLHQGGPALQRQFSLLWVLVSCRGVIPKVRKRGSSLRFFKPLVTTSKGWSFLLDSCFQTQTPKP